MNRTFTFSGKIDGDDCVVFVDSWQVGGGYEISPTGFRWGYGGAGPARTAWAVLEHVFGEEFADEHAHDFKDNVVANLPFDEPFTVTIDLETLEVVQ